MNLYLSRLFLNPRSRQVMNEIAHPYEMHRTLMRAFPEVVDKENTEARDSLGILFRAEDGHHKTAVKVYVQSYVKPHWSYLDELKDYLYVDMELPGHEYKDILPAYRKIQNGQVFSFRLRANPTKRVAKRDDPLKGKRVELRSEEEQIDWLVRKGHGVGTHNLGGFEPFAHTVRISSVGKYTGYKSDQNRVHRTAHFAVLYDGLLRVTDKDAFLNTMIQGVGPGKAFGFGLLSIAPSQYHHRRG